MTNSFEFTDKKQVFAQRYMGEYATRKVLNRSTKQIPNEYIKSIESGNVTSLMLEELNKIVPVYIYKTCITIHGNLPQIGISYIGGYKNVIQNGNGSIEFRYSAIDCHLKKELSKYLNGIYYTRENSTNGITFELTKIFNDKIEAIQYLQAEKLRVEGMNIEGLEAKIFVDGFSYFGRFYITTYVFPMLIHGNILSIATSLTGLPENELRDKVEAKNKENEERQREIHEANERLKQKNEELASQRAQMEANLSKLYRTANISANGQYITTCKTVNNKMMYMLIQTVKGTFGRVSYKYQLSENTTFLGEFKDGMRGKQVKPTDITKGKIFEY